MFTSNHPLKGIIVEMVLYLVFFITILIVLGVAAVAIYKNNCAYPVRFHSTISNPAQPEKL